MTAILGRSRAAGLCLLLAASVGTSAASSPALAEKGSSLCQYSTALEVDAALAPGHYLVEVGLQGYAPRTVAFDVEAGVPLRVEIALEREPMPPIEAR